MNVESVDEQKNLCLALEFSKLDLKREPFAVSNSAVRQVTANCPLVVSIPREGEVLSFLDAVSAPVPIADYNREEASNSDLKSLIRKAVVWLDVFIILPKTCSAPDHCAVPKPSEPLSELK